MLLPEGLGLPGAASARTVESLDEQVGGWSPEARAGVRLLVRTWEWNPLLSSHLKRFSRLSRASQRDWIDRANHSKLIARRLQLVALKQLLTLAWASSPEVEDALGFDYRCRRDDEPHGAGRAILGNPRIEDPGAEPPDYVRPGPAVTSGAIPLHLTRKRDFRPAAPGGPALATHSWPELDDGRRERADVVVIGSGAGGAVAAATLARADST